MTGAISRSENRLKAVNCLMKEISGLVGQGNKPGTQTKSRARTCAVPLDHLPPPTPGCPEHTKCPGSLSPHPHPQSFTADLGDSASIWKCSLRLSHSIQSSSWLPADYGLK